MRRYEHLVGEDLARYDRATSDGERRALHILALRALHGDRRVRTAQTFAYGVTIGGLIGVVVTVAIGMQP